MKEITTFNNFLDKRLLLDDVIAEFIKTKESRYTQETYRRALKQWIYSPTLPENIDAYKYFLIDKGLKPTSVCAYLTALREFLDFLEHRGEISNNPAKNVKGPKKPKGYLRDELSEGQAKELLSKIDRTTLRGKRNYAIVSLMVITGLRSIEVIRTNVEDLREKEGRKILYVQGKGRSCKDDFVVVDDVLYEVIEEYLGKRGYYEPEHPLFASVRRRNARLTTAALRKEIGVYLKSFKGPNRISLHSLRHTAITIAFNNGASLFSTQQMARHDNINTTLGYFHRNNRLKNSAESIVCKAIFGGSPGVISKEGPQDIIP